MVLGVDIAVLGVDRAILGVDITNLRRPEKKGGATGGGGRGRLVGQDALKRVGSPVSLETPRAARGVERRVIGSEVCRRASGVIAGVKGVHPSHIGVRCKPMASNFALVW